MQTIHLNNLPVALYKRNHAKLDVFAHNFWTVADIDMRFFFWRSPHRGGSDEPKHLVLGPGTQEEKAVEDAAQTHAPNLYIY